MSKKKFRDEAGVFLAEGAKVVGDILPYFRCRVLCATKDYLTQHPHLQADEVVEITEAELLKCSQLKTPRDVVAVFEKPAAQTINAATVNSELCLMLDGVQDPGNLGTILRVADWFGIRHILCSEGTVDVFNPKCVQSCMGALARVKVHSCNLGEVLLQLDMPIYGTFLDGKDIYQEPLSSTGVIIMGNEGKGISPEIANLVNRRLYVPNYPQGALTTESLNVAVCTGIVCAEFCRRMR